MSLLEDTACLVQRTNFTLDAIYFKLALDLLYDKVLILLKKNQKQYYHR